MFTQAIFLSLLLATNAVVQCLVSLPSPFPSIFKNDVRANFKGLIATHPNYFGNLPNSDKPVVSQPSYDTQYKQLQSLRNGAEVRTWRVSRTSAPGPT